MTSQTRKINFLKNVMCNNENVQYMNLKNQKPKPIQPVTDQRTLNIIESWSLCITAVMQMTPAPEMCSVMISSLTDSSRCLCLSAEPVVAMSHYPLLTNGKSRQIIHLP